MKAKIHLEENLDIKANPKGEIITAESKGVLKVINPSEKTTLWGINLELEKEDDVEDFTETSVPHVEAGKEYLVEYGTKIQPKITINEAIDSNYDNHEFNPNNEDLVFNTNQNLAFEITIANDYHIDLKNIIVEKHLPVDTKEIRAIDPFLGEVNILEEERIVNWIIPVLEANSSTSIIIASNCYPTNVQPYKTGIITFRCELGGALSSLKPGLDGDCDNVDLGLEVVETTGPNQWQVDLGLRNASEFEIILKDVKIEADGTEAFFKEPRIELDSHIEEPIWTEKITIESVSVPEITKKFDYSVLYDITKHSTISYEKDNSQLQVVKVNSTKFFEPPEVTTYAVTGFAAIIDITNTGTATVGRIEIEDTIPSYLEIDNVSAESSGGGVLVDFVERPKKEPKPVVEEREKATFEEIDEVEEEVKEEEFVEVVKEDITLARKYNYVIDNMKLEPGQILKVKVIGKANKPRIEGSQKSPSEIKAYAQNPTKPHVSSALSEGREPAIIVEFKQRSYKITSIFTKQKDDTYNIEIPIVNTGDVALDHLVVIQPIFTAEYVNHTPPTVDTRVEESSVRCHIKRINAGETVTINLIIRTEGPLRQQQATIKIEE